MRLELGLVVSDRACSRSTRSVNSRSSRASPRRTPREIAVGQPVTITFPALPDTEVAGRVAAVSLTSTVVSDVVTYDETIALDQPARRRSRTA